MHVPLPGRQGARGPRGVRRGGVVLVDPGRSHGERSRSQAAVLVQWGNFHE